MIVHLNLCLSAHSTNHYAVIKILTRWITGWPFIIPMLITPYSVFLVTKNGYLTQMKISLSLLSNPSWRVTRSRMLPNQARLMLTLRNLADFFLCYRFFVQFLGKFLLKNGHLWLNEFTNIKSRHQTEVYWSFISPHSDHNTPQSTTQRLRILPQSICLGH